MPFTRTAEQMDRARDLRKHDFPPPVVNRQLLAVAMLVGECESLVGTGALTEPQEQSLRILIAHTLAAFNMPSKAERSAR